MADTAQLGVSVDVSSVRAASVALGTLVSTARTVETQMRSAGENLARSTQRIEQAFNQASTASERLNQNVQRTGASLSASGTKFADSTQAASRRATASFDSVGSSAASMAKRIIAAYVSISTVQSIYKTSVQLDMLDKSFGAIVGSSELAAGEMAYVRAEAERLGQGVMTLAQTYRGFAAAAKGAGMDLQDAKGIFSSVSESATVLGLSSYKSGLALYALEQMISKGSVTMEELRRQLGDQIPGAFSVAAKAMNMTEKELSDLIKTGSLATKDFLPKFAAELNKTFALNEDILRTPAREMERFKNELVYAQEAIAQSGFLSELTKGMKELTTTLRSAEMQDVWKSIGEGLGTIVSGLATVIKYMIEWRDVLLLVGVAWYGLNNVAPLLTSLGTGIVTLSTATLLFGKNAVFAFNAWRVGAATASESLGFLIPGVARLSTTLQTATASATLFSRAIGVASVAIRGLLLSLGPIAAAATLAYTAYSLFSSSTQEESEQTGRKLSDLSDRFKALYEAANPDLKTAGSSIGEAQQVAISRVEEQIRKIEQDLKDADAQFEKTFDISADVDKAVQALQRFQNYQDNLSGKNGFLAQLGASQGGQGMLYSLGSSLDGLEAFGVALNSLSNQDLSFLGTLTTNFQRLDQALKDKNRIEAMKELDDILKSMSAQKGFSPEMIKSVQELLNIVRGYGSGVQMLKDFQDTLKSMQEEQNRTPEQKQALLDEAALAKATDLYAKFTETVDKLDPVKKKELAIQKQVDAANTQAAAIFQALGLEVETTKGKLIDLIALSEVIANGGLTKDSQALAEKIMAGLKTAYDAAAKAEAAANKPKGGANRQAEFLESMRQKVVELTNATHTYQMEVSGALSEEIALYKLNFEQQKELFELRKQAAKAGIKDTDEQFRAVVSLTEQLYAMKRSTAEYEAQWAKTLQPLNRSLEIVSALGLEQEFITRQLKEQERIKVSQDQNLNGNEEERQHRIAVIDAEILALNRDITQQMNESLAVAAEMNGYFIESQRLRSEAIESEIALYEVMAKKAKTAEEQHYWEAQIARLRAEQREAKAYAEQDWGELFNIGLDKISSEATKNFLDLWKEDIPNAIRDSVSALSDFTYELIKSGASWEDFGAAIGDILDNLGKKIMEATFQMILFGEAASGVGTGGKSGGGGLFGGLLGGIGSLFSGLFGTASVAHTGGTIGQSALSARRIQLPADGYSSLPRFHEGGIVGGAAGLAANERLAVLEVGEEVHTPESMASIRRAASGGDTNNVSQSFTFNNTSIVQVDGSGMNMDGSQAQMTENVKPLLDAMRQEMSNIVDTRLMYQLRSKGLLNSGM